MTNKEILTKAIQKANSFDISIPHFPHPLEEYEWNDQKRYWFLPGSDICIPLFEIIYQHGFAKALWGDAPGDQDLPGMYIWEDHLMRMVIAPDPIKYLEENI